jgi:hypothetical protein
MFISEAILQERAHPNIETICFMPVCVCVCVCVHTQSFYGTSDVETIPSRTELMKMARRVARETASKVAEAALKARAHAGSDIVDAPGAMGMRSYGPASVAAKGTPRAARRLMTMRGRDALSQLEEAAAKNRARHGPLK